MHRSARLSFIRDHRHEPAGANVAGPRGRNALTAARSLGAAVLLEPQSDGWPPPVEFAVAVERYLASAALGAASRRVYRISLAGWAWPLVGKPAPSGTQRRGASPPIVPLMLLDNEDAGQKLAAALLARSAQADGRTVSRELSA